MNKKQKKRLTVTLSLLLLLSLAAGLVLYALKQNINLFFTPTQLLQAQLYPNQTVRIGGYVKKNSVNYDASGQHIHFLVTDNKNMILVNYHGILPNLFREGQGVVVTGQLNDLHTLNANQVLAKHDEKYMPWPLQKEFKERNAYAP